MLSAPIATAETMNVVFLPSRLLKGVAHTTPIMLHTSPMARNTPAKKMNEKKPKSTILSSPM